MTKQRCPEWADDAGERTQAFLAQVNAVYDAAIADAGARGAVPHSRVRRWHREMFKSIAPHPDYAGNYRQASDDKPCLYCISGVGGILGSPPDAVEIDMQRLFGDIDRWLQAARPGIPSASPMVALQQISTLVAKSVGQFIRIHPFVNGNGRTSRLLWATLLRALGLPAQMSVGLRPPPPYGSIMQHAMNGNDAPLTALVIQHIAAYLKSASLPPS